MQLISRRVGYLVGRKLPEREAAAIQSGAQPRPEFSVFAQRNNAMLLSFDDLESSKHPLMRFLRRRNQLRWGLVAAALARHKRFDVLLTSGEDLGLKLALLAWVARIKIPIYIITHGSYFASAKYPRLLKLIGRMKNVHHLCLSDSLRRMMVADFGVPAAQVHNTSYYTDAQFFRPLEVPPSHTVVASGMANRDYRTLVRAAASLDVDVRIAGDSAWFKQPLDIAADDVPSNIDVRSYDYLALRALYASAAFVIVPLYPGKHAAGYSAVAEAQAMGKAVITTRTGSESDFVIDGETGFYVSPGDAKELRGRMEYLLRNHDVALRMGQQARKRAETFFSAEAYCARMEQVIHDGSVNEMQREQMEGAIACLSEF
jgi:glycosyltransferase involved in cell wall biosynthesis